MPEWFETCSVARRISLGRLLSSLEPLGERVLVAEIFPSGPRWLVGCMQARGFQPFTREALQAGVARCLTPSARPTMFHFARGTIRPDWRELLLDLGVNAVEKCGLVAVLGDRLKGHG